MRKIRGLPAAQLVELVAAAVDHRKDLYLAGGRFGQKIDQKIPAQKLADPLIVPGLLRNQRHALGQLTQGGKSCFQCGQKGICGARLQQFVGDVVDDLPELPFCLWGKKNGIIFHGSNLRTQPGKRIFHRDRFAAPGLFQPGLEHPVKFLRAQGIARGKLGSKLQRERDAVAQDDLTVGHINKDRDGDAQLGEDGFGLFFDLRLDAGGDIGGFCGHGKHLLFP